MQLILYPASSFHDKAVWESSRTGQLTNQPTTHHHREWYYDHCERDNAADAKSLSSFDYFLALLFLPSHFFNWYVVELTTWEDTLEAKIFLWRWFKWKPFVELKRKSFNESKLHGDKRPDRWPLQRVCFLSWRKDDTTCDMTTSADLMEINSFAFFFILPFSFLTER